MMRSEKGNEAKSALASAVIEEIVDELVKASQKKIDGTPDDAKQVS
jgi:hypothetical protein